MVKNDLCQNYMGFEIFLKLAKKLHPNCGVHWFQTDVPLPLSLAVEGTSLLIQHLQELMELLQGISANSSKRKLENTKRDQLLRNENGRTDWRQPV